MLICVPSESGRKLLGDPPDGVELIVWNGSGEAPRRADEIEFLIGRDDLMPPPREALAALAALQVVQSPSAGVDAWLPLVPDGVRLCSARGAHGPSTAEVAVAGAIAVLRRFPELVQAQAARQWQRSDADTLADRKVLVLGAGDIGERVAVAMRAFDAEVTLVARHGRAGVRELADLPALLPEAQVVVLSLPHTPESDHLVDAGFLAALPDGALVVNVSRGGIVDTDALLAELTSGRLRAFLDVTDPEPLPADHPLWTAPNLMVTPHIGGATTARERRVYRLVREQIRRYAAGEPLLNEVDGY
ncbi:2-hydroxyacid dehydrogenase [uncultured Jatrophihabitans sp.]|uniref:2-hydroxyacid dehydrogenase n=1 Tax=uncultured Jatrophihabitans sp. TaxID=1610747 RepID=UPI0035CB139C